MKSQEFVETWGGVIVGGRGSCTRVLPRMTNMHHFVIPVLSSMPIRED